MKYVDFKKFTQDNGLQSVYLFEGEETYFRDRGPQALYAAYLKERTLDYTAFDGTVLKGDKLKTLSDALNSFPFLGERRFVAVTEFYPTEKEYDFYLASLFENPPSSGTLIIVNSGKGKTGSAALAKKPNVTYVDCSRADEETMKKWIFVTCKRAGIAADGITCGKLVAYCAGDMARVANETEKLLIYCRAKGVSRLTDEIVDETVYPDSEYKIYELSNAIARKNYSAYTRILGELRVKGFDAISLLGSLGYYFKGLYEASVSRGGDKEIAASLGVKEYAVRKNREQAARFPEGEVLRCYRNIYAAVSGVKCGELTPDSALKTVTARLFFGGA